MTQEMKPVPTGQAATATPHINIGPLGMQGLELYKSEIATYLRELPRLLDEGYACKYALVKGDEILSIWDTQNDAIQAGVERFGVEPIFVKAIDARDKERFALLKAQLGDTCPF
jgi:hypothetical protein